MHSTGKYERIEVDFQHNIPLGLMRDIYYRFGWGAFTNQKELYFVDFANLARSNLPVGWNDEIGGVRAQSNGFYPRTAITISRYFACREMVGEWCLPDKLKALVLFNEGN